MNKKFSPKEKLQELVSWFEQSIASGSNQFFSEEELEQIIEHYESIPNYEKAFIAVEKAIELFAYSGAFYIKKAQLCFFIKDYDKAWEVLDQAAIFEAQSPEMLLVQVDLLSAEGYFELAVEKLQELMQIVGPAERVDVMLEIADVYDLAGEKQQLGNMLKRILLKMPLNEEALHRYWNFIIDVETYKNGIEFFQELIELDPYNFLAWYYIAKCYEEVGLHEKASDAYEYSIAINDEYYFTSWDYGQCLQTLELWQKAISAYEDMLVLFNQDASVLVEIANCYRLNKEYKEAMQHYILAKEQANDKHKKANCEYYIGVCYEEQDNVLQAIRHYQLAIELRSKKTKFWNALARCYIKNSRYEDATNCLLQSLDKNDEQSKQWIKLVDCYHQLEAKDLLIDTLHRAHSILPSHVKLSYYYAAYLLHYGFMQSGLMQLEHALSLNSSKKKHIFALFPELKNNIQVAQLCEQF